jgi:hypothetical protein
MYYTLGTAAKATGKSKPTIMRAIKTGKISAIEKTADGYKIDPAELHRVFPLVTAETVTSNAHNVTDETGNFIRIKELEMKLEAALQRVTDKEEQLEDVRKDRDHWRSHAERSTLLIEDMRLKEAAKPVEPPKKRSWFNRS